MKTIFTVTMVGSNSNRVVGWFDTYENAEEVVLKNVNDIQEHNYFFCVIEEINGNYPYPCPPKTEQWFRWYKKESKFRRVGKPEMHKHVVNFGIG